MLGFNGKPYASTIALNGHPFIFSLSFAYGIVLASLNCCYETEIYCGEHVSFPGVIGGFRPVGRHLSGKGDDQSGKCERIVEVLK
jgi:hypothetical protein